MAAPHWLIRSTADVAADDGWLGEREQDALAKLRAGPRREHWRLGRWTAKAAVCRWLEAEPQRVEILAAPDGAPEAWLDGERLPISVSLSHRGGRALAAVTDAPRVIGCDLELVEPRSDAFVREWLAPSEQSLLRGRGEAGRALLANLIWTAKEAATKVRREGLRLDVRRATVTVEAAIATVWQPLRIDWRGEELEPVAGWWRTEPGWVMTVAGDPAPELPEPLSVKE